MPIRPIVAVLLLISAALPPGVAGQDRPTEAQLVAQWQQGLAGARLTAYSGSAISSNSTLTTLELCRSGRYRYVREGSWSVPGQAGGASSNQIQGRWQVQGVNGTILILYETDQGEKGAFPVYLQADGRVNIGGEAYRAEPGAAGC